MRRTSLLAASVIALTMALPMAQASAAPASDSGEVGALACSDGGKQYGPGPAGAMSVYYKHCTDQPYAVKVTIDYHVGNDGETCVQPNERKFVGYSNYVNNVYYNGKLC